MLHIFEQVGETVNRKKTIHVGNNNIIIIVIIIIIITIFTTYKHDKNYYYCTLKRVSGVAVCTMPFIDVSGAGTNLKVGAPVRSESGGNDSARSVGKIYLALKVQ